MHKHLPSRWDSADAWYFVTVVTHQRYPYFESEEACKILMAAFHFAREKRPHRLGALVIMPEHWHALIRPKANEVIESIVGSIKQRAFHSSRQAGASQELNNPVSKKNFPVQTITVAPSSTAAAKRSYVGKSGLWTIESAMKKITCNISNICV